MWGWEAQAGELKSTETLIKAQAIDILAAPPYQLCNSIILVIESKLG